MTFDCIIYFPFFFLQSSSSPTHPEQLIRGSILLNDEDEIDDLSWKKNRQLQSSSSNTSFNPGGKYVSDDSGGPGGYLAPTHIQRRIVTSSPGVTTNPEDNFGHKRSRSSSDADTGGVRPQFHRQQTFPEATDNNIQPWINPYLSKPNLPSSAFVDKKNTSQNENSPSSNNAKQSPTTASQLEKKLSDKATSSTQTWKNPYWKDWKPQNSSTSNKQQDKPWENPYWKDGKPQNSSTSDKQQDKPWQNPYWKDNNASNQSKNDAALSQTLSPKHKLPSVPSFYHRIYPPCTPLSSPVPIENTKQKTIFSNGISEKNINDDEDLPYTINSQGVARYKPESSSPNVTNKTSNIASSSANSQYPVSPPSKRSFAPFSQTTSSAVPSFPNNIAPTLITDINNYPSSSFNYHTSPTTSCVLTETDLNSIQHALHLLETNPNAIPIIEAPHPVPSSNISQSPLTSSFTVNREQQQPLSSFSRIVQSNSQQPPLFSTPSYPINSNQTSRLFPKKGSVVLI